MRERSHLTKYGKKEFFLENTTHVQYAGTGIANRLQFMLQRRFSGGAAAADILVRGVLRCLHSSGAKDASHAGGGRCLRCANPQHWVTSLFQT